MPQFSASVAPRKRFVNSAFGILAEVNVEIIRSEHREIKSGELFSNENKEKINTSIDSFLKYISGDISGEVDKLTSTPPVGQEAEKWTWVRKWWGVVKNWWRDVLAKLK